MDNDYNRPRRPNAETLTYLKSLPFNEAMAHEEISAYIEYQQQLKQRESNDAPDGNDINEVEYPQNLQAAFSALDEITHEIASLAGDEFGSQCLETITRITAPYSSVAVRKLLNGIRGYLVHLSTHRYGSHVVQTILQNVLKGKNKFGLSDKEICDILEIEQEDDDETVVNLPPMKDILFGVSEELIPVTRELAVHICGSHVLRSLLCILKGIEEEIPQHLSKGSFMESGGTRRGKVKGKKKKKKNKATDTDGNNSVLNTASFSNYKIVSDPRFDINDTRIDDTFFSFVWELTGIDFNDSDKQQDYEVGDLQQLTCNPSAGPLMIVLLRILTLSFSSVETKQHKNIDEIENNDEKSITEFRLGIIPQQLYFEHGSYAEILAKRILCWNNSIDEASEQKQSGEVIYGLSGETRGSHMLEMLLRTSNDAFYDMICQAGRFLDRAVFAEYAEHDVSNFVLQTLVNTVRTRSQAECVVKCIEDIISNGYVLDAKNKRRGLFWRVCEMAGQETILKFMRRGFTSLKQKEGNINKEGGDSQGSTLDISECIRLLMGYKAAEIEGGRIGLDAAGARATYHLLRFVPRLTPDILAGIVTKHKSEELFSICCDGFGSRCVIDGILEGPMNQESFANATKQLLDKLKGHIVTLSVHRVGHHTIRKIFMKLKSFDEKESISAVLSKSLRNLSGNAMGKSVISDCAVREYLEGEESWKRAVKKAMEKETFLKEIVEGDIDNIKKRKRKRKKKDNDDDANKLLKVRNENEE